jgi:hypothetical protein
MVTAQPNGKFIKLKMKWSDEYIEKTIKLFKPYADAAGEDFTREDAVESINNMVALFDLLIEMDRAHRREEMTKVIKVIKQLQISRANN